jgi:hypothetical protein
VNIDTAMQLAQAAADDAGIETGVDVSYPTLTERFYSEDAFFNDLFADSMVDHEDLELRLLRIRLDQLLLLKRNRDMQGARNDFEMMLNTNDEINRNYQHLGKSISDLVANWLVRQESKEYEQAQRDTNASLVRDGEA